MEPYQIIKRPLITEKGMRLNEEGGTVVFRVDARANKLQIKHAVEVLFNVKVTKVNTLRVLKPLQRT
jgi:large subunit ribosomal protein L23